MEECIIKYKDSFYLKTEVGYKKIILTDDKNLIKEGVQSIDDEFLEWFIKNPSCNNVEVESINIGGKLGYLICKPKLEPKQETLNLKNLEEKLDTALSKETSESLTNWLQNKKYNQKTLEETVERLFPFTRDDSENRIITIKRLFWINGAK